MPHVTSKSWTADQLAKLKEHLARGQSAFKAAAALRRSIISVQNKARELGTPFPAKRLAKKARLTREQEALRIDQSTRS